MALGAQLFKKTIGPMTYSAENVVCSSAVRTNQTQQVNQKSNA